MKTIKIAIISPDTVPLELSSDAPDYIVQNNMKFNTKDKCCKVTSTGKRSWAMAHFLSNYIKNEVTLFIPDLNYPGNLYINSSKIDFKIEKYNFYNCVNDWSEELHAKLIDFDYVIIQSTVGAGWKNCSSLPKKIKLIVDGWAPMIAELPYALDNYPDSKKEDIWNKFQLYYNELLNRADIFLYANNRQKYMYQGQFFINNVYNWKNYDHIPMLKIPYGIDLHKKVKHEINTKTKLKLLWYGALYPWYAYEEVLETVKNNKNIKLDFIGARHPRYTRLYDSFISSHFKGIDSYSNIRIFPDYVENKEELFSQYDAAIIISQDSLEEMYSHRVRILEMISYGLPVITNKNNVLFEEYGYLKPLLYPIDKNRAEEELNYLTLNQESLYFNKQSFDLMQFYMNWKVMLKPLETVIC